MFFLSFNKSLPKTLIIKLIGVIIKKNITNITIGEITFPSISPNLIQPFLKGDKILKFNKPEIKKKNRNRDRPYS